MSDTKEQLEEILTLSFELLSIPMTPTDIQKNIGSSIQQSQNQNAKILMEAGHIEASESYFPEAMLYYQQAMDIYKENNEPKGIVETLLSMELVTRRNSGVIDSLKILIEAFHMAKENHVYEKIADIYSAIGNSYENQDLFDMAQKAYEKALTINRIIGDKRNEAKSLGHLGNAFLYLQQYEDSVEYYQQAIRLSKEIGDQISLGKNTGNLGMSYQALGKYEESMDCFQQAIQIHNSIGNKRGEGIALGSLAVVFRMLGQYEQAIQSYTKAIQIAQELEDMRYLGLHWANLGAAYQEIEQYNNAISAFEKSILIDSEIGSKRNLGLHMGNYGNLLFTINQIEDAKEKLKAGIELCQNGFSAASAAFSGILAIIYAKEEKKEEALELLQNEIHIVDMPIEHAKFLCRKALVYHYLYQQENTRHALHQALEIANQNNTHPESELGKLMTKTENEIYG